MTESVGYCAHTIRVNDADRWHDRAGLGLTANCLARWKIFTKECPARSAGGDERTRAPTTSPKSIQP